MPSPRRWPIFLMFALASAGLTTALLRAQALAADTPQTTAMGATFIAPAGWSVVVRGPATILEAPEHDSHIALVDIEKAAGADAAVAAAWAAYRAEAKWPLKVATPVADEDGWTNQRSYSYETSPNERREVWAQASQHDGVWTVAIVDMSQPTAEKRLAQVALVFSRLLPKGYSSRDLCRQAGPSARRSAHRGALGVRRARAGPTGCTRRRHRTGPERQGRPRGRLRRPRPRQAGEGRRRHALHDRVEHQGDDDAAPREARRRQEAGWDTPVTSLLPTFKLGDADTTRQVLVRASHLRVHGAAAPGFRMAPGVQERDAGPRVPCSARCSRPASSARCSSTRTSWRGCRRLRRRTRGLPGAGAGRGVRRGDADRVFEPLGDDGHHVRFRAGAARPTTRPRTRSTSTASPRAAVMARQLLRSCRYVRLAAHGATSATCCGT